MLLDGDNFLVDDDDAMEQDDGDRSGNRHAGSETNDNENEDPGFASVKAGRTITIKPIDNESEFEANAEALVLKQDGRFRVMRNDKRFEWVDIIVPHFGASSSSVDYRGLITSLTVRDSDHHVLLPFIDFIGLKLLSLDIRPRHGNVITTDFLRRVLTACPNVTEFQIGKLENSVMTAFTEAYESGKCQVERLHVRDPPIIHTESIRAFARVLKYPDSTATKNLRRLELLTLPHTPQNQLFDGSVFAALAEMLEVNRTIEYLEIDMRKDLRAEYASAVEYTSWCRPGERSLCPGSRYAFLSVLQPYTPSTSMEPPMKRPRHAGPSEATESGWGRLDGAVISSIFAFAAEILTQDILISTVYVL